MMLIVLHAAAALVVVMRGVFVALNGMSAATCHAIRWTWIGLTTAAAAMLLTGNPAWPQVAFEWAVVALIFTDRRQPLGGHHD